MSRVTSPSPTSNKSSGSRTSQRSLRSNKGVVDPTSAKRGNKGKGKANARSAGRTSWTPPELDEFIKLLLSHHASAGDNNFKEETFNKVAAELNGKFPLQKVLKTGKSCRTKWSNIKAEYTLISEIRGASGFHYDDKNGAVIDDYTRPAWVTFCKSYIGAAKYEGAPWPYWDSVSPLMPSIAKGTHVLHPGQSKPKRGPKKSNLSANVPAAVTSAGPSTMWNSESQVSPTGPLPMATLDADMQMIVDDPTTAMSTSRAPAACSTSTDPNSIPPSTPSTFLSNPPQSTVSMATSAMTSVSQKRKVSSIVGSNAGSEGSQKRSRLPSAAAQTRAAGDHALQRLTTFLDNIDPAMLQPVTLASLGLPPPQAPTQPSHSHPADNDYIEQAATVLMSFNLGPSENNDLADYMSDTQNKMRVKFFLKFDLPSQEMWIKNTLAEIQARKDSETARKSMDGDVQLN